MSARLLRRSLLPVLLTSLSLVLPTAVGTAAPAPTSVLAGAAAVCDEHDERDEHDEHAGGSARSTGDRPSDTAETSRAELREVQRRVEGLRASGRTRFGRLASEAAIQIPVHVHVLRTKKVRGPSPKRVDRQLRVLEDAFAGGQSETNTATDFSFVLASLERVRNRNWYRARIAGKADRAMRKTLHRGGPDALNVYIGAPRPRAGDGGGQLLGWSSLPWQAANKPRQDGVTLHRKAMAGGAFAGYDEGDTLVHEVGHWLGLLHTFEGGCADEDFIEDTPPEAYPSTTCRARDSCDDDLGPDPIHNFMDYSPDACMYEFTPGQVAWMADTWTLYRAPTT